MKEQSIDQAQGKQPVEKFITGFITSVNIKGVGQNSAHLLFTVEDMSSGESVAIMATAYPDYEPQLFASVSAFVTSAYFAQRKITAGYYQNPEETARVMEVFTV
ncbi:MAG: hypothetical protein JNK43_07595 [Ignavibacteria bacterium]|nr:hypothetical protein [Ignavibacteria bacterium]